MLKQMISDDRNEAVREAVTKSLALVVAFIENVDKYEQVKNEPWFHIMSSTFACCMFYAKRNLDFELVKSVAHSAI